MDVLEMMENYHDGDGDDDGLQQLDLLLQQRDEIQSMLFRIRLRIQSFSTLYHYCNYRHYHQDGFCSCPGASNTIGQDTKSKNISESPFNASSYITKPVKVHWSDDGRYLLIDDGEKSTIHHLNTNSGRWGYYGQVDNQKFQDSSWEWVLNDGNVIRIHQDGRFVKSSRVTWQASGLIKDAIMASSGFFFILMDAGLMTVSVIDGNIQPMVVKEPDNPLEAVVKLVLNVDANHQEMALQVDNHIWVYHSGINQWSKFESLLGDCLLWKRLAEQKIWTLHRQATNSSISLISSVISDDQKSYHLVQRIEIEEYYALHSTFNRLFLSIPSKTTTCLLMIYRLPGLDLDKILPLPLVVDKISVPKSKSSFVAVRLRDNGQWKFIVIDD